MKVREQWKAGEQVTGRKRIERHQEVRVRSPPTLKESCLVKTACIKRNSHRLNMWAICLVEKNSIITACRMGKYIVI